MGTLWGAKTVPKSIQKSPWTHRPPQDCHQKPKEPPKRPNRHPKDTRKAPKSSQKGTQGHQKNTHEHQKVTQKRNESEECKEKKVRNKRASRGNVMRCIHSRTAKRTTKTTVTRANRKSNNVCASHSTRKKQVVPTTIVTSMKPGAPKTM